jgi:hypothetical protein
MPYIVVVPLPGLVDNPRWQELIDEVARAKRKRGLRQHGSVADDPDFKRFECCPQRTDRSSRRYLYLCTAEDGGGKPAGDWRLLQGDGDWRATSWPGALLRCSLPVGCYRRLNGNQPSARRIAEPCVSWCPQEADRVTAAATPNASPMPPPFDELRALPSLPPDTIRKCAAKGMPNDWTSPYISKAEGSYAADSTHAPAGIRYQINNSSGTASASSALHEVCDSWAITHYKQSSSTVIVSQVRKGGLPRSFIGTIGLAKRGQPPFLT